MADRIARHRAQRPPSWITIEEPLLVAAVLADCPSKSIVVIDCLTLWVSNLLAHGNDECAIVNAAKQLAATAHTREAPVIVVTNEVGSGIVPIRPLARTYRDILGRVNATLGAAADTAYLAVAGRLLPLSSAAEIALE